MAIDKVAEDQGGMMGGHSAGSWPRDVKQAYNLKCNSKPRSTVSGTDPYLALVMQCKEEAKDNKTAYIRKVICAPEPIVILSTEEQLDGMERFCTNGANFGVFSIDPTFDRCLQCNHYHVRALKSSQPSQWGEPRDDRAIDDSPKKRKGDIQHLCRSLTEFKTAAEKLASCWNRW